MQSDYVRRNEKLHASLKFLEQKKKREMSSKIQKKKAREILMRLLLGDFTFKSHFSKARRNETLIVFSWTV
jgi:hypothetical protein